MLMTVSVTYRSRMVSACLRSLVLLQTWEQDKNKAASEVCSFPVSVFFSKLLLTHPANINKEVLKKFPHVVGRVDLLHFHLRVHVAVI